MKFEVKNVHGHYELFVDGKFHGSFDTMVEAAKEIDDIRSGKEAA
jgi:hypothetical protein